ncbi:MAG: tRNA (adenosine(37)-N6)-threonylcarbamoyltransferase complex dimerization subunit type 1 TsaB [Phycisphaerae bacterium]|nr:tRNA (adenosine(37)-N6)-threonylcarbamoyltransferase complex dimerization subunit type 1 TsaB [Phycisphaerae bacterium]
MTEGISIAIETSCRAGGVALGVGDELRATRQLGPSGRHAAALLAELDALLSEENLRPADVGQVYISVGPGSFTGLRVGVTVARTLGQAIPSLKIVAVPTPLAIAENIRDLPWEHLGVLLAAKEQTVHATLLGRDENGLPVAEMPAEIADAAGLLEKWPRPLLLSGEGLGFCEFELPPDVTPADEANWMPAVQSVWQVGQRLAGAGCFTPYNQLQPVYARRPEAVRLWEQKLKKM